MGERLRSVTRRIRCAVATWCKFFPEINRKLKLIRSSAVAIFQSQIRLQVKKVFAAFWWNFTAFCAILQRQIRMKTKKKAFTALCAISNRRFLMNTQ